MNFFLIIIAAIAAFSFVGFKLYHEGWEDGFHDGMYSEQMSYSATHTPPDLKQ